VKSCLAVLAFLTVPLTATFAQSLVETTRPERGTRIRITEGVTSREGVLVEWRGDSAFTRIDATGDYVLIPPSRVPELELYDGLGSVAGKGAMIGGGIGLGLGLLVVVASAGDSYTSIPAGEAVAVVGLNTAMFAGIGALIGSAAKRPKWRAMDSGAVRVHAGVTPRGGVGLGFSVGF
jgi:hypothetical protein